MSMRNSALTGFLELVEDQLEALLLIEGTRTRRSLHMMRSPRLEGGSSSRRVPDALRRRSREDTVFSLTRQAQFHVSGALELLSKITSSIFEPVLTQRAEAMIVSELPRRCWWRHRRTSAGSADASTPREDAARGRRSKVVGTRQTRERVETTSWPS